MDSQRDTVSDGYCTSHTRSRTLCGWTDETPLAMDTAPLTRDRTNCGWTDDETLVNDGYCTSQTRPRTNCGWTDCKRWILHLSDEITYCLWVDRQRDTVRDGYCSSQTTSHTNCGWTDDETLSAMNTAPLTRDHVRTVGGQTTRHCQPWIQHLSHEITYIL